MERTANMQTDTVMTLGHAGMLVEIHQDIEGGEFANPRENDGNLGILAFESHVSRETSLSELDIGRVDLDDLLRDCEHCEGTGNATDDPEGPACPICDGDGAVAATIEEYFKQEHGAVAVLPIFYADYGSSGARVYESDDPNGVIFATMDTATRTGVTPENYLDALQAEIRVLDIWLQGGVYGYVIREREGGKALDSCWGFLADYDSESEEGGWKYLLDTAKEAAESIAEEIRYGERSEIDFKVTISLLINAPDPDERQIRDAIYQGIDIDTPDAIEVRRQA